MPLPTWFFVTQWIAISCAMILFNKAMLDQFKFPYPMFLTTWHMFLATVLTQIMSRTTSMLPGVHENKVTEKAMKTQLLPVAIFFSFSLVLSNKAYIYLSVSYIQMLKACTPVAVLLFSFVAGIETPSYLEVCIVAIISTGVAMTSVGEMHFSMIGFTFQSLGILAESAKLVMVNALMKDLKLDPLSSLYYIAPLCFAFIAPACLYFEGADVPLSRILSVEFGGCLLLNGLMAFLLNVAVVLLIHNKSALILTLAGILKDLLLVCLSMIIFGSPVTKLQYVGYAIALLGLNIHKEYKKSPEKMSAYLTSLTNYGDTNKAALFEKDEEDRLI